MQAKPESDPTSWKSQASIHSSACMHNNWYFLPWHRAYLKFFEDICAAACGNPNFAVPYWDWTAKRSIPEAFRAGKLSHRGRTASGNADEISIGPAVIESILNSDDYQPLYGKPIKPSDISRRRGPGKGALEGTPHNYIHRYVGGDMNTMMPPRDPLFWPHHANVDRIWTKCLLSSGPSHNDYLNGSFDSFYKPDGSRATAKVADATDHRNYGYRYDTEPEQKVVSSAVPPAKLGEAPSGAASAVGVVRVAADAPSTSSAATLTGKVRAELNAAARGELPRFRLTILSVQPPKNLDVSVSVFLNTPGANRNTPTDDPGYVGAINFFAEGDHAGHAGHDANAKPDAVFGVTRVLGRLAAAGRLKPDAEVKVDIVVVPLKDAKTDRMMTEVQTGGFTLEALD